MKYTIVFIFAILIQNRLCMFLQIWFPQIVIVVGGIGALLCFAMVFFSHEKSDDDHAEHGH